MASMKDFNSKYSQRKPALVSIAMQELSARSASSIRVNEGYSCGTFVYFSSERARSFTSQMRQRFRHSVSVVIFDVEMDANAPLGIIACLLRIRSAIFRRPAFL